MDQNVFIPFYTHISFFFAVKIGILTSGRSPALWQTESTLPLAMRQKQSNGSFGETRKTT